MTQLPLKKFFAKKSFGQNFLINAHIQERIINSCGIHPQDTVLEIGPGQGALTKHLALRAGKVIAIEKDKELARQLKKEFQGPNVEIIQADILDYPFASLPQNIKLIGNLPYNIATVIIEKVLMHRSQFNSAFITIQLEHGQRLVAKPDLKQYGYFSCFVQYYSQPKILFKIPPSAFRPVPKVQSCLVSLEISKQLKHKAEDEPFLFHVIQTAFQQRRKTIENSLSKLMKKEDIYKTLSAIRIKPSLRAENLRLEDYIVLSEELKKQGMTQR